MNLRLLLISFAILISISPLSAQFQLNGSAVQDDADCFTLTDAAQNQSGSVWYLDQVDVNESFDLYFQLFLGFDDGGADGVAFVLQQVSTSVGVNGGGLGYQGVAPSLAIEFDTWQNEVNSDPTFDHIGIMANGNIDHGNTDSVLAAPVPIFPNSANAENGEFIPIRITWNADSNILRVFVNCELRTSYTGDIVRDIFNNDSNVFWGFTAATGGFTNLQQVCRDFFSFEQAQQDTTICQGDTIQMDVGSGSSYLWSPGIGLSDSTIRNPLISPDTSITYTVSIQGDCSEARESTITVNVNPTPTLDIIPDTVKCGDDTITLFASGADNYLWSPAISLNDSSLASPEANPDTSTLYQVIGSTFAGCQDTAFTFVRVMQADAGPDTAICIGDSIQLLASGGIAYQWEAANGILDLNIPNPIVNPTVTTSYIVTVSDSSGCTDQDTITITVNPLPVPSVIGTDPFVCSEGESILIVSGGVSYNWRPDSTLTGINSDRPTITPVNNTDSVSIIVSYFVTVTDANGCSQEDSIDVEVRLRPVMTITEDTTICPGETITLLATGGISYDWAPNLGLNATDIENPVASPSETTTYTATVTARWGCTETDSVTISIIDPDAGPDVTICAGDTAQLSASGGIAYAWFPADGLSNANIANPTASPLNSTQYIVRVTDAAGCFAFDTMFVRILGVPDLQITGDSAICIGESTVLQASGANEYEWFPETDLNGTRISNPIASPEISRWYFVRATSAGCSSVDSIFITVNPLPNVSAGQDQTSCPSDSVSLQASGALSYSWQPDIGISNPNIASPLARPGSSITYTVIGTDANGCQDSDDVQVEVLQLPNISADTRSIICVGESDTLSISGAESYLWSTGSREDEVIVIPDMTDEFWVIPFANGCAGDTVTFTVDVEPRPQASFGIFPSEGTYPFTIFANNNSLNANTFFWDFGDGNVSQETNPSHLYTRPGEYQITLIADNDGTCPDTVVSENVKALDYRVFIPSSFSPNGDDINDQFTFQASSIARLVLVIWNRNGREVFRTTELEDSWDGTFNGVPVPEGVYSYRFAGITFEGTRVERAGTVTIVK